MRNHNFNYRVKNFDVHFELLGIENVNLVIRLFKPGVDRNFKKSSVIIYEFNKEVFTICASAHFSNFSKHDEPILNISISSYIVFEVLSYYPQSIYSYAFYISLGKLLLYEKLLML